jgi:hypothetical protein
MLAAELMLVPHEAWAGDRNGNQGSRQQSYRQAPSRDGPGVGGYSSTLSDIWGPAEMPPAPKDFGPHFDFQPEPLSGGLSHDPYPN